MTDEWDARIQRVEDMGPLERAFAEAMHEGCEDGPAHDLAEHSPWRGDEVGEPWDEYVATLRRHDLVMVRASVVDELVEAARDLKLAAEGHATIIYADDPEVRRLAAAVTAWDTRDAT